MDEIRRCILTDIGHLGRPCQDPLQILPGLETLSAQVLVRFRRARPSIKGRRATVRLPSSATAVESTPRLATEKFIRRLLGVVANNYLRRRVRLIRPTWRQEGKRWRLNCDGSRDSAGVAAQVGRQYPVPGRRHADPEGGTRNASTVVPVAATCLVIIVIGTSH